MAKVTPIQTNFTGGEISPRLLGRVDLQQYVNSVQRCENFICFPHGGITKRSGTRFVAEVKNSSQSVRLIPFIYSTVQAYVLEFGHQYVRFYRDEGQIQSGSPAAPYEIASPYDQTELADLKFTQSADILYLCHSEYQPRKLSRTGHTAWSFSTFDAIDGPWDSVNATATTLTPSGTSGSVTITASAVTGINSGQGFLSTDVGRSVRILSGGKWGSAKITAVGSTTSATATTFDGFAFENTSASTNWRLGIWSNTTKWPRTAAFYQQRLFFASNTARPNTIWASESGNFETFSPTNREAEVLDDAGLSLTLATDQVNAVRWMYGAKQLQLGTSDGPFIVSSGSDDLALTPSNATVHRETTDGTAHARPIGVSRATLFIDRTRTKIRELAYNLEQDGFTTPDLTLIAEHITTGNMAELAYTRTPDSLLWARLDTGGLRCLTYEREQKVVAWHRHILGGVSGAATITVTDYANITVGTKLTLTKSDGTTVTFTSEAVSGNAPSSSLGFRPNQDNNTTADNIYTAVNAHADFTVANPAANVVTIEETSRSGGGFLTIASTDTIRLAVTSQAEALVTSIAAIPTLDELEEQLYLIVTRTINGQTKKYIEFLEKSFDQAKGDKPKDAFFVDSGLSYDNASSAVTAVSGLGHLEGETVRILANGANHASKVVSSGAVSLDRSANTVHVGLEYRAMMRTLDPEVQTEEGPSQGKTRRIERVTARVVDTYTLKIGDTLDNLQEVPFRTSTMPMGELVLFTGDKRLLLQHTPNRQFDLFFVHLDPLPCTILAIMYAAVVSDR